MLYVALIAAIVVMAARFLLPQRHVVHAARVTTVHGPVRDRFRIAAPLYDERGERLPLADKFVGRAYGSSMVDYSIPHGATFVATRLSAEERKVLTPGELVVIDAPTKRSKTGLRLRCIEGIRGEMVRFKPDQYGEDHTERSVDMIIARVTHVIEERRPVKGNAEVSA